MGEQLRLLITAREQNLQKDVHGVGGGTRGAGRRRSITGARARYERLVKSKGENVVVGVQHGVCGGCHMRLPAQLLVTCQAIKRSCHLQQLRPLALLDAGHGFGDCRVTARPGPGRESI